MNQQTKAVNHVFLADQKQNLNIECKNTLESSKWEEKR